MPPATAAAAAALKLPVFLGWEPPERRQRLSDLGGAAPIVGALR